MNTPCYKRSWVVSCWTRWGNTVRHPPLTHTISRTNTDTGYVGADSSIRWNHAARMARGKPSHADPKIIPPMKTGLLPPTSPESPDGRRRAEPYLPPRQLCMTYVARFFDQIHCIYWFYSAEQFHSRLHNTYDTSGTMASSSWLCSLYSIFAMGSMSPVPSPPGGRGRNAVQDSKTALDYLALAKSLSAEAADEADVDSIKAFGLLVSSPIQSIREFS